MKSTINFMGVRKIATGLSVALVLASVVSLFINGINFGLDFTGGTQIEVSYSQNADLDAARNVLSEAGLENFQVAYFGSEQEVLIRIQDTAEEGGDPNAAARIGEEVVARLQQASPADVQLQRSEYVGSVVGAELREQGGLGMLVALGMVMIYIAMRFQFKFAVGAVTALAHDIMITLGFFSVMQVDFDLTVLAALLAVIGYSLNDTIVVFDRVRENFRILRNVDPPGVVNQSVTQTISRTLVTSLTTLFVLLALFYVGGPAVHGFAEALIVGVIVGTYSSIYVASNVLLYMHVSKEDLMPPAREEEEADAMP